MASMQGYLEVDPLVRRLKSAGMINKFLQNICIAEGVSKAGVKAELQSRLIESTFISNLSSFLLGPRA
jgi:E3 SUMO-protein ligase PIAS1